MRYYANAGPLVGPVRHDDTPRAIGVLKDLDRMVPVGVAARAGRDADGVAIWRLRVEGDAMPGRWVIVGREFRPL